MVNKRHLAAWLVLILVLTACSLSSGRSIPTFIFLGASNMDSRRAAAEDLPAYLTNTQTDVYYSYSLDGGAFSSIGFLRPVVSPAYSSSPSLTGFGADITTARQLADSLGSEIAVIKNGRGGATLADHFGFGDVEYNKIVAEYTALQAYLASLNPPATTTVVAVFTQLGENDAVSATQSADFSSNLTAMVNGLRNDLSSSNLLVIIQETWSPEGTANWPANQLAVRDAERALAASDPRIGILRVEDLAFSADAVHFTSASELTIGDRFFAVYQALTTPAPAGSRLWDGDAGDYSWFNPTNWDGDATVPGPGEDVSITALGGKVVLSNATAPLAAFTLSRNTFSFSDTTNLQSVLRATNVDLGFTAIITLSGVSTLTTNAAGQWAPDSCVHIQCSNLTMDATARVDADGKGYGFGKGPGAGTAGTGGWYGGGGYGGVGGMGGGIPASAGVTYGSFMGPIQPGSGGGRNPDGGSGGGWIRIDATGHVDVNGVVTANGTSVGGGNGNGAGSGGGIFITCHTFGGSNGVIAANGGDHTKVDPAPAAGGGGRIAIVYDSAAQSNLAVKPVFLSLAANQGHALQSREQPGTIYMPDAQLLAPTRMQGGQLVIPALDRWSVGDFRLSGGWLIFTNGFVLTVTNGATVDSLGRLELSSASIPYGSNVLVAGNLTVSNGTMRLYSGPTNPVMLSISGSLAMTNGGVLYVYSSRTNSAVPYGAQVNVAGSLTVGGNSWIYPLSDATNGGSPIFRMQNLTIAGGANAGFNANVSGFGGLYGPGKGTAGNWAGGGGYGGAGGKGDGTLPTSAGGPTYGSSNAPVDPGSGGGKSADRGGGLVRLEVANTATINGSITANGMSWGAGDNSGGGGGAGGGIYLVCRTLAGTNGILAANGGTATLSGLGRGGGGGGGRIAVWRLNDNTSGRTGWLVAADGGAADHPGAPGTIVWGQLPPPATIFVVR